MEYHLGIQLPLTEAAQIPGDASLRRVVTVSMFDQSLLFNKYQTLYVNLDSAMLMGRGDSNATVLNVTRKQTLPSEFHKDGQQSCATELTEAKRWNVGSGY